MPAAELPYLDTFARAAERMSFTAAARELGVSQAAVSQRVQALEGELGVSLFRREGGRVLLTEAGRKLYDFAQRIQALQAEARREVTGKKAPLTGELTIAASSVPGEYLLPDLLTRFRERHPHVRIRATVSDSDAVFGLVEQGKAHLGLVGGRGGDPSLEFHPFAHDEMVLVVPPGHPWAQRRQVPLAQFRKQPLVLRESGSGSRSCLERGLVKAGVPLSELTVAMELGSNESVKEAVLRGVGVAVLSRHAVAADVRRGSLHALKVGGLEIDRDLYWVRDRRRVLPVPAKLFLDLMQ